MTYELSSYPRRALAGLLDLVVYGGALLELWILVAATVGLDVSTSGTHGSTSAWLAGLALLPACAGVASVVWVLLAIRLGGSTPGKAAFGLRVVGEDGLPPSVRGTVMREVVLKQAVLWTVTVATLGLAAVVDLLWPLWDAESRALHDRVARTRVVRR